MAVLLGMKEGLLVDEQRAQSRRTSTNDSSMRLFVGRYCFSPIMSATLTLHQEAVIFTDNTQPQALIQRRVGLEPSNVLESPGPRRVP